MHRRMTALILLAALLLPILSGCALQQIGQKVENTAEKMLDKAISPPAQAQATVHVQLTPQEAETIALEYVELTADDVKKLRTEFEIDDGVPLYQVEFRVDRTEYEFEIHAETGKILSYEKD